MKAGLVTLLSQKQTVLGGLILLVLVVSSIGAYRIWKTDEAKREAERVVRVEQAETGLAASTVLAEQERQTWKEEQSRLADEEAERQTQEQQRLASEEQQRLADERAREQRRRAEEARLQRAREQEAARARRQAEEAERARTARLEQERRRTERRKAAEREAAAAEGYARQQELERRAAEKAAKQSAADEKADELEAFQDAQDETPTIETESTIDRAREVEGWKIFGDLRPIIEYETEEDENGVSTTDGWTFGGRARLGLLWGALRQLQFGARLAGVCFTSDCDLDFVMEPASPVVNGLSGGQVTFDQLYMHWFRTGQFDLALGRLQTRFVLRGGVYAKSLDRNDSNNVNVTWTDGLHGTYRIKRDHEFHLVLQRNVAEGTGSIRRDPLDFDDSRAHVTYFAAFENIESWGPLVQRAIDLSYLPSSLLKDGTPDGRREDYWAPVVRLAFRWPNRSAGLRLRAGTEIGYAFETQTCQSAMLDCSGDVNGFAWNIVASAMEFAKGQSIGINYGRTGPGWYLSPQYGPNEELFEIRHQWKPKRLPLLEARVRWRRDLQQQVGTLQKAHDLDFYLRASWEFTIKDF